MKLAIHGLLLTCLLGQASLIGPGMAPRGASLRADQSARPALESSGGGQAEEGQQGKHEGLFKVINFVLLVGGLGYLLRKPLAGFLLDRSASIRKSLEEGRKALEESQAKLQAVEEKLTRLEEELRAFKASQLREMDAEHERLRQASAEEAEKILEAARTQIELAARVGLLELKSFATHEAVKLAEELIRQRLDEAGRSRLVQQFISRLEGSRGDSSFDLRSGR